MTTTRHLHRRAVIIHPTVALTLATLLAWLATPAPTRPGWVVVHSSFDPVTVTVAVLATLAIGVLIVRANRGTR